MGKSTHITAGGKLRRAEYEAAGAHLIGGVANLDIVRAATLVVAPSDASAQVRAESDYVCDGTADEVQIKAALAAAPDGHIYCHSGTYYINDTITIAASDTERFEVLEFARGSEVVPSADVNLFTLSFNGVVIGATVRCDTYGSYTKDVFTITKQFARLEHIIIRGSAGTGTGKAIVVEPVGSETVAYNFCNDIYISHFEYAIYLHSTSAAVLYVNHFRDIIGIHNVYFWYEYEEANSIHGNRFIDFSYQADNGTDTHDTDCIHLEGSKSRFTGQVYDFSGTSIINLVSGANYNAIYLGGGTSYYDKITNSGYSNTIFDEYGSVLHQGGLGYDISNHSASANTATLGLGCVYTNFGATGTITITLRASLPTGTTYHFVVRAPYAMRVAPSGTGNSITINGAEQAQGKYIWADDEGESVMLVNTGSNKWIALYTTGTWGVQG